MIVQFHKKSVFILILGILTLFLFVSIIALINSGNKTRDQTLVLTYEIDIQKLSELEISEITEKYILPTLQDPCSEEQVHLSWKHTHQGIKVIALGKAQGIKFVKKADRLVRLQLPAFIRIMELAQRQESKSKMQILLRMLRQYKEDGNDKLPDSLDELKKYDADNTLSWILENIEYLGRGKSFPLMQGPIAYDKSILAKGDGTNVLYAAGIVYFTNPIKLEKLGIVQKK